MTVSTIVLFLAITSSLLLWIWAFSGRRSLRAVARRRSHYRSVPKLAPNLIRAESQVKAKMIRNQRSRQRRYLRKRKVGLITPPDFSQP